MGKFSLSQGLQNIWVRSRMQQECNRLNRALATGGSYLDSILWLGSIVSQGKATSKWTPQISKESLNITPPRLRSINSDMTRISTKLCSAMLDLNFSSNAMQPYDRGTRPPGRWHRPSEPLSVAPRMHVNPMLRIRPRVPRLTALNG